MRAWLPPTLCLLLAVPAGAQQPAAPAPTWKTFAQVAVFPERDAPAGAVSRNESRIAAEIPATIAALPVDVGQVVGKGAVVARLDCRDYDLAAQKSQAALDAAAARAKLAESQLARARELHGRNFISADALTQRETESAVQRAEVKLARAQLDTAKRAQEKCVLRAPFPAIVKARQGQVGELAAPGTPLLTLVDAGTTEIAAQVQVRDAESLKAAKDIRFVTPTGSHAARLLRVSPAINRDARNVEARLAFADQPAPPGSEGRIVWRDPRPHLPAELVSRRAAGLGVFVLNSDTARFVPLPGAQEGRPAPADLPADTRVVIDGRHGLRDGQGR